LGCQSNSPDKNNNTIGPSAIFEVLQQSTEMMVHDVSNPPLAARFFAYTCLGGYAAMSGFEDSLSSLLSHVNAFPQLKSKPGKNADEALSTILAMAEVSSLIQPSGKTMKSWKEHFMDSCRNNGWNDEVIQASNEYAVEVANTIREYAQADGYKKLSNFPRYAPKKTDSTWYATPPGYFPAVEPYFSRIRPFMLDTTQLDRFKIPAPESYSKNPGSAFMASALQVFQADKRKDALEIAAFWDCNPFALSENGHLLIGMKKISPGAHWMGISAIACKQAKTDFKQTMRVQSILAMGMMDAFWLCWREKYRSDRIRPETAIRKLIDPQWKPFLQTPPFPEYPSGHSVVSSAAAIILTQFFGENFSYTDTVERRYGITDRKFSSFKAAAEEASISRFYGGIHFKDAIENGQVLGSKAGNYFLDKLQLQ
jgi:hypothetical protein